MSTPGIVTRFAPSPTGRLHAGNARTALFNYLYARRHGGRFLLRIEDSDRARSRPDRLDAVCEDLRWLGLAWDAGPDIDPGYLQSNRGEVYARYFALLEDNGSAYPCYCTDDELAAARAAQLAAGRPPRYPGTCRALGAAERAEHERAGRRPALRFRIEPGRRLHYEDLVRGPQHSDSDVLGDFVIRRSDGSPAFFFCNAIDDALMNVSHALRGEDHLANTPRQLLLLEALDLTGPRYGHLPLLLGLDGAPLAKRTGAASLDDLRIAGYLPQALQNYLARLGHHYPSDDWRHLPELAADFSLDRIGRAPAHFDPAQLDHWQRGAVARLDGAAAARWLAEAIPADLSEPQRRAFVELVRPNALLPGDARAWARIIFDAGYEINPAAAQPDLFATALQAFRTHGPSLAEIAGELRRIHGVRGRMLYAPLRYALTGREDGPELAGLLALMPPEVVRRRLERAGRR